MGRVKQYDKEEVLRKALITFREKGYENTTMRDLSDSTGINPFSLYAEFNNKSTLFGEVMRMYQQQNLRQLEKVLAFEKNGFEKIQMLFKNLIKQILADTQCLGCLKVNTATLGKAVDDNTQKILKGYDQDFIQFFKKLVEEGQNDLSITAQVSARELATLLYSIHHGIRVIQHTNQSKATLEGIVAAALAVISK
ncbi:MAG: TetR/AcrR family transcriptional regulator [Thermonemataceae bacterium]